jgi:copper oxidase (laccase) domain-containing protein
MIRIVDSGPLSDRNPPRRMDCRRLAAAVTKLAPESPESFGSSFQNGPTWKGGLVDLPEANRSQLVSSGSVPGNIFVSGLCTCYSGDEFHPWRREQSESGRMLAIVGITKNTKGTG